MYVCSPLSHCLYGSIFFCCLAYVVVSVVTFCQQVNKVLRLVFLSQLSLLSVKTEAFEIILGQRGLLLNSIRKAKHKLKVLS